VSKSEKVPAPGQHLCSYAKLLLFSLSPESERGGKLMARQKQKQEQANVSTNKTGVMYKQKRSCSVAIAHFEQGN